MTSHRPRSTTIIALAGSLMLTGCGAVERVVFGEPAASETPTVAATPPVAERAEDVHFGVCLDPSGSVPRWIFDAGVAAVADAVDTWPRRAEAGEASRPWPSLRVQVRGIGATSYDPGALLVGGSVRGIPSVIEPGDPSAGEFLAWDEAHRGQLETAEHAYDLASREGRRLARDIRTLHVPIAMASEIHGCFSALAESFPPSGIRKLLAVTDLKQSRPREVAGGLEEVDVLIIHVCDRAQECRQQRKEWDRLLARQGADKVSFARVERMEPALRELLGGEE